MIPADWRVLFENELAQAELARSTGNEGKARVCARRAAGEVIREYLRGTGQAATGSAYELIASLGHQPDLTNRSKQILEHLLLRVEPGGALPERVDLIDEVRELKNELGLNEPPGP